MFRRVFIVALLLLAENAVAALPPNDDQALPANAGVSITKLHRFQKISAPGLEMRIAPDGCVTYMRFPAASESFRHLPGFVKPGIGLPHESPVGGSRGAFFYQDGPLCLPDIHIDGSTAIVAESLKASIRYEFAPFAMNWTLTNKTARPMQFFMVIDPAVTAVTGEPGKIVHTPAIGLWPETTWFEHGNHRIHITGGDRIWSAGTLLGQGWTRGQHQVWEATLKPGEVRAVHFDTSPASADQVAAVTALGPLLESREAAVNPMIAMKPALAGALQVYSPRDYQVFQRQTRTQGNIIVEADAPGSIDKLQVRISGSSIIGPIPGMWIDVPLDPATHSFHASIPTPSGGWYRVDFRAPGAAAMSLAHVGVGEVFVTCGQSNSTNCGPYRTKTQTGMVSGFSGDGWFLGNDPLPGAGDLSEWGSPWPSFGDAMYARWHVPIGIAITGIGGAPVQTWSPGTAPFIWTMNRINELGPHGFRGLLWHQGESNSGDTTEFYFNELSATIAASYAAAGWKFPWFIAHATYTGPKTPVHPNIRAAQERLWTSGIAFEGADTDTLIGPTVRAGGHLYPAGLKAHGEMWAEKVSAYLDKALKD